MQYLGNTADVAFEKGYIALHVPVLDLPKSIEIDGKELLLKTEFHVSLLYVEGLSEATSITPEKIIELFDVFLQDRTLSFGVFTGDFRYVTDEARGRETVIGMCTVNGFEGFAEYLSKEINFVVEPHPTHVTLYTLQPDAGIGVNNPSDFARTKEIDQIPEALKRL